MFPQGVGCSQTAKHKEHQLSTLRRTTHRGDFVKLVIVSGMPGAGKTELATVFGNHGVPIVVMGDVIRREATRRGLSPNPANTRKIMLELRDEHGPGAVAEQCIKELKKADAPLVVIEGCRSIVEVEVFDRYADAVTTVSVHSSPRTRFARLVARGREDAPRSWDEFRERDLREISVGLGGVIAMSDIMIVNEGSVEELRQVAEEIARRFIADAGGNPVPRETH